VTHTRPEVPGFCLVCRERFGGQKRPHQTDKDSEEPEAAVEKHFKRNDNPDFDVKPSGGSDVVLGGDVMGGQVEDLWLDDDEIEEVLHQLLVEKEQDVGVVHQQVEDLQSDFGNATNLAAHFDNQAGFDHHSSNSAAWCYGNDAANSTTYENVTGSTADAENATSPPLPFGNATDSSAHSSPPFASPTAHFSNSTPSPAASENWSLASPSGTVAVEVGGHYSSISGDQCFGSVFS
jgi:hypothetical protein